MKKRHVTTLEIYAKTIRMRTAEKRALRERLVAYMEYHPSRVLLREVETPRVEAVLPALSNDPFIVFRFSSWQFKTFSGVFLFILMVGMPLFAEHAVPGDALYAMKVHINEEVKASLAWTPAEKIAWQAERVERRIAEARLLAKEGNLTSEAEAAIAVTVREHAESASREIAELRTTDAEGAQVAQVALESTLEVQTAILATESGSTTASTTISSLAATVAEVQQGVSAHDPVTEPTLSYERMSALLESETTRARELAASIEGTVTEEEKKDIERRLADAERSLLESRTLYSEGKQEKSSLLQRKTLSDIQKLISFMTDIDIRASISLESIVPMKLTADEQLELVSRELETLKNEAVTIHKVGREIEDAEVSAKYARSEADLDAMIVSIEAFRSEARPDEALALVADAKALVVDLKLLNEAGATTTLPIPEPELPIEDIEDGVATNTSATTTGTTTEETE